MYPFGQTVTITCSGESGEVVGIATFPAREAQYLIRYAAADGRAVEAWWDASALQAAQ